MYSALALVFLFGSASAETGYERNQAGNPKPVGTSPVAVPPPLPVLLAQQDPCLDNGMGGTTGRGDWPPMPVDPNSVQCVDVSTQWQNIKLCHASGVPENGPSDAIYDKCHELYEENDCYRPGDINTGCIYDAILHCKSQYVSCSPPSAQPSPPSPPPLPPSPPPPPPSQPPSSPPPCAAGKQCRSECKKTYRSCKKTCKNENKCKKCKRKRERCNKACNKACN